jgi:hypothetical protein
MMAALPEPPVTVYDWYDIYMFEPTVVECPDCEQRSPEMENVYALARWTVDHANGCKA